MVTRYSRAITGALTGALTGFLLLVSGAGVASSQEAWDPSYYNPAGDPDVLLLPIPCGGKIALKKVVTITEDPQLPPWLH